MSRRNTKKIHLHNYTCDGKIIQAIMKQNQGWPYEVDGKASATLFLHLKMFQKENGMEATGYIERGARSGEQLFSLAKGQHKDLQGFKHLGEAFVYSDINFASPTEVENWHIPPADLPSALKAIKTLQTVFDFPDMELRPAKVAMSDRGHAIFQPCLSPKYWLQKDGLISEDYPMSIYHRLHSTFSEAGFKVLEASPKGVTIESISKYEGAIDSKEKPQGMSKMSFGEKGIALLKGIEQLRLKPYDDQTGKEITDWIEEGITIGYGHLIKEESEWELYKDGITKEQAERLFKYDGQNYIDRVNASLKVKVTQQQFDALVILCYNIGKTGLASSSVIKLINDPAAKTPYASLEKAWKAWDKSQGKVNKGVINRRNAEWNIYSRGIYARW